MPQQYSPTAVTPYEAPVIPEPAPPPPPSVQAPGYQFNGAGISKVGAVAGVLDNIFRGYVNGKAQYAANQVMKLKKRSDDLQASYNQDAQRLLQYSQAGVDPNSPEFKQAKSAVDGSWGALQEFRGQMIAQQQPKKKGKGKQQQPDQNNLVMRLQSQDPNEKAQALYELSQKAGPPVYGQVALSRARQQSPQYQASLLKAQHDLTLAQATEQRDKLLTIPAGQRTKEQNDQIASLDEQITGPAKPVAAKPGDEAKHALDDVFKRIETDPHYQLTDEDKTVLQANKMPIGPKTKLTVTREGEILMDNGDGTFKQLRGPQASYAPRGRSGGGSGGGTNRYDKSFNQARSYLKEHNPTWDDEKLDHEADKMAIKKATSDDEDQSYSATQQPKEFDNKVLTAAVDRMMKMPQYYDDKNFTDQLANFIPRDGEGRLSYGKYLGKPTDGKYSGNMTLKEAQHFEMDLQQQIKAVLNDPKVGGGLSAEDRRAVVSRMRPYAHTAAKPPENKPVETHEEAGLPEVQGHKPPGGASAPVYGEGGHSLIGWVVNGEYQPLK